MSVNLLRVIFFLQPSLQTRLGLSIFHVKQPPFYRPTQVIGDIEELQKLLSDFFKGSTLHNNVMVKIGSQCVEKWPSIDRQTLVRITSDVYI